MMVFLEKRRWLALGMVAVALANQFGCCHHPAAVSDATMFQLRLEAVPKQVRDVYRDIDFRLMLTNVSSRPLSIGGWQMSLDDGVAVAAGRHPATTIARVRKLIQGDLIVESFSLPHVVPQGQLQPGSSMELWSTKASLVPFCDSRLEPGPDPGNWYVVAAARIPRDVSDPSQKSGPNDFVLVTDPLVIRVESDHVPKSK